MKLTFAVLTASLGLSLACVAATSEPVPAADPAACCPAEPATACCPTESSTTCCAGGETTSADSLKEQWGIEIASLRMSAAGIMIDFRYKVLDAAKAAALGDEAAKAYLIDEATGRQLLVPTTPKIGRLRQTAEQMKVGRVYFALFSNPGRVVKAGSKVTVVIGDFRAEHLTVE